MSEAENEKRDERRFTDSEGNTYSINPDAPTLRKIRDDLGVNLSTPTGYSKMRVDPLLVADVMEYLCRQQRESFERSQADFSRDVLRSKGQAVEAISKVMEDFLDEESLATLLEKKQMTTAQLRQDGMEETIMELIDKGNPAVIKAAVQAAMGSTE